MINLFVSGSLVETHMVAVDIASAALAVVGSNKIMVLGPRRPLASTTVVLEVLVFKVTMPVLFVLPFKQPLMVSLAWKIQSLTSSPLKGGTPGKVVCWPTTASPPGW